MPLGVHGEKKTELISSLVKERSFLGMGRAKEYLERLGYNIEVRLSCEWVEENGDLDNHHFLQNMNLRDLLCPPDSFFGGLTNACRLHHKVSGNKESIVKI